MKGLLAFFLTLGVSVFLLSQTAVEFVTLNTTKTEGIYEARQSVKLTAGFSSGTKFNGRINPQAFEHTGNYKLQLPINFCENKYLGSEVLYHIAKINFNYGEVPEYGNLYLIRHAYSNRGIGQWSEIDYYKLVEKTTEATTIRITSIGPNTSARNQNLKIDETYNCSEIAKTNSVLESTLNSIFVNDVLGKTCNKLVEPVKEIQLFNNIALNAPLCPVYDAAGNQTGFSPCVQPRFIEKEMIEEVTLADKVFVSPNPTEGEVLITWDQSLDNIIESLFVISYNGLVEIEVPVNPATQEARVDLSSYSDGIYFLTFYTNTGEAASKTIIKN